VIWPDGSKQEFTDLPARSTLRLMKGGEIRIEASGREAR